MASRKVFQFTQRSAYNSGYMRNFFRSLSRYDAKLNQPMLGQQTDKPENTSWKDPFAHEDFFGVRDLVKLNHLFDARVHMGHHIETRHVTMRPFLFGTRLGMDIIDLDQTLPLLQDALNFIAHIAYKEGIILFVSRHMQTLPLVESTAMECGEYSHCRKWNQGTFTNSTKLFAGLTRLPDLCVFLSTHDTVFEQHQAVTEAAKCNIPSVGILDSSCDARLITYPVPGNDDSPSAIKLYCQLIKEAILLGKQKRKKLEELEKDQSQKLEK